MRPLFGSFGGATNATSLLFTSQAALDLGIDESLDLLRALVAVTNCRELGKADLKLNEAMLDLEVDPETYEVWVDSQLLTCDPATVLPMAQRYFLF